MYYYLISPNIIVRKDQDTFTYHSEQNLSIGSIVRVSIGKKECNGIIRALVSKPEFQTKPIVKTLTTQPLPKPLIDLINWLSKYYATPLPLVIQTVLPSGLHKKRRQSLSQQNIASRKRTNIVLNKYQHEIVQKIIAQKSGTMLLHGVTGSGKTQIYIEAAKHELSNNHSSIILVPEIALTTQLVAEFSNHFQNIIVTHSNMTESERHKAWEKILNHQDPVIVIGPRSALFMPIKSLGLIVIDEFHEPGFKQEQSPKYSALRSASILAKHHQAKTILGSATPSITEYYLAKTTKKPILELTKTAIDTQQPKITLIDSTKKEDFREHRFLSDQLLKSIRNSLRDKKQTLLFHNRRGTAPIGLCNHCGWTALCPNCNIPSTLHADKHKMLCHMCGLHNHIPKQCPECQNPDIVFRGIGTKLLETELTKIFPKTKIARFDADNSNEEALHNRYQQLYNGEIDIIIGTQLIAKGLDLPNLDTVGIIQADSGLQLPDYQAEERVFQLLYQAAGRVGRGKNKSQVIIQTYHPNHPIIKLAIDRNYKEFYELQKTNRQQKNFPPFTHLLKLTCSYKTESSAIKSAKNMAYKIKKESPQLNIVGPAPAFYERLGGNYRWQLIIKSKKRGDLISIANNIPNNWQSDLDPSNLL